MHNLTLQDMIHAVNIRVHVPDTIKFKLSTIDRFAAVFAQQAEQNEPYYVDSSEELEFCLACAEKPANMKIVKRCRGQDDGDRCDDRECQCRAMWWVFYIFFHRIWIEFVHERTNSKQSALPGVFTAWGKCSLPNKTSKPQEHGSLAKLLVRLAGTIASFLYLANVSERLSAFWMSQWSRSGKTSRIVPLEAWVNVYIPSLQSFTDQTSINFYQYLCTTACQLIYL